MPSPLRRSAPAVALAALLCACRAPSPVPPADVELFVLGIAQDGGLPQLGCEKACCAGARASGRALFPASLGVVDRRPAAGPRLLLVEATPRIEEQVAMLHELAAVSGRGRAPVDAVLLTHAHLGHYLGLALFGREVAGTRELPVHCSPRLGRFLSREAPWRQLVELHQVVPTPFVVGEPFSPWPGLEVRAIAVPHRDEFSDTMAFVLRGPHRRVLFVPDVDAWEREPGLLERLLDGVDVAYLDATFYDGTELPERNLAEIRHPFVVRTMDLLAAAAAARPGAIRFLHCNHTNPLLRDPALVRSIEARGFALAAQGERLTL